MVDGGVRDGRKADNGRATGGWRDGTDETKAGEGRAMEVGRGAGGVGVASAGTTKRHDTYIKYTTSRLLAIHAD